MSRGFGTLCLALTLTLASGPLPFGVAAGRAGAADVPLTQYVNPFIGTAPGAPDYGLNNAAGDTFPGAVTPNGMVQFSPDTTSAPGGYRYNQHTINAFSLTHFSGRGVACWEDIGLMPTVGPLGVSPGANWPAYASPFAHTDESASPGAYHVRLDRYGIGVDLTATTRTGFARFTYPASTAATLLIDAGHSAQGDIGAGTGVDIVGPDEVTGSAESGNCGGAFTYRVYFAARFDRAFTGVGTWNGGAVAAGSTASGGAQSGAYVTFDTRSNSVVRVKVGLSFVSVANAQANLAAEDPGWDFATVADEAAAAWNARLNSIQVQGGAAGEKTVFYTALYHASIHPSVFSDANGQYLGFDGRIHAMAAGHIQYHNYPGWDNYRSEMPLVSVIAPAQAADMMQSLVNMARQDPGGGLPRWEQANGNSGGMVGDSQLAVIASAHAFGVTAFDTAGALAAMVRDATVVGATSGGHLVREGLGDYLSKGYVAQSTNGGSAAITLEYATDDFALSQFARALGDTPVHDMALAHAQNWKNLFDAAAGGYIAPRDGAGHFIPFAPTSETGFVESDGAQYVWMVPFNYRGLFDAMGGDAAVVARLDRHFTQLDAGPHSPYAFMGNEPEEEAPWAYDFAGAPYRTQDVVRRILLGLYGDTPGGMPGNDDGGAMGSWVVWASIGLYPDIPGVGGFVVGSPLFSSVTVRLAGGKTLRIAAPQASDTDRYVQGLTVNGGASDSPWLPWAAVSGGGVLDFSLGGAPNTSWGASPAAAPPSFDVAAPAGFNNEGISSDSNPTAANYDGHGYSYSSDALKAAGFTPGSTVTVGGVAFRWPAVADGTDDNWQAAGQTIVPSSTGGARLAFLGSATNGPSSGAATVTYTDGATQTFTLAFGDWTLDDGTARPLPGNSPAACMTYRNGPAGPQARHVCVFFTAVPLAAGKTVRSVTLPDAVDRGHLHVFAASVG